MNESQPKLVFPIKEDTETAISFEHTLAEVLISKGYSVVIADAIDQYPGYTTSMQINDDEALRAYHAGILNKDAKNLNRQREFTKDGLVAIFERDIPSFIP